MRALIYRGYGGVDRLQLTDHPPPAGAPLVRVAVAALNPKDSLFRKGKFALLSGRSFPKQCGLDFAGTVERAAGDFAEGDRVFGALNEWRYARGTLAELVSPRLHEMARIPPSVDPADAASVALVGLTSLQALRDVAKVAPGASVLIHGASGGVGTAATQIARRLGATVTTVSGAATKPLCASLGSQEALDYEALPDLLSSRRFDVVLDVFGSLPFARARGALRETGTFVSTVPSPARFVRDLVSRVAKQSERLIVVRPNRADLDTLAGWLSRGELRAVIDMRVRIEEFAKAFERLESKHAHGKILVDIG